MRRRAASQSVPPREARRRLTAAGREEESLEREERRGLEARGGVLLGAGAAAVGLVATAARETHVHGWERDLVLGFVVAGSLVMLVAFWMIARALSLGRTNRRHDETRLGYAARIRENNYKIVRQLGRATWVFAASIAFFLVALILAAILASPPPSQSPVTVIVKSLQGEKGLSGPRGPGGPRGRRGVKGERGPEGSPGRLPEPSFPEGS
jgi:hypothetical protein